MDMQHLALPRFMALAVGACLCLAADGLAADGPVVDKPTSGQTAKRCVPEGDGWVCGGVACEFNTDGTCTAGDAKGVWRIDGEHFIVVWTTGHIDTYERSDRSDEFHGTNEKGAAVSLILVPGARLTPLEKQILGVWDWGSAPGNRVTFTRDHRFVESLGTGGTTGGSWRVENGHIKASWDVGYRVELFPVQDAPAWAVFAVAPDGNQFFFAAKRLGYWPKAAVADF